MRKSISPKYQLFSPTPEKITNKFTTELNLQKIYNRTKFTTEVQKIYNKFIENFWTANLQPKINSRFDAS